MKRHTFPPHYQATIGAAGLYFIPHTNFGKAADVLDAVKSSGTILVERLDDCYLLLVVYARIMHNKSFRSFEGLVGRVMGLGCV